MTRRLLFALAALLLAAAPAFASGGGGKGKTRFNKLPAVAVELWDQNGIFHQCVVELVLVMPEEGKVEKGSAEKVQKALSIIPYEEFVSSNPAALIKTVAYEVLHKEKGGEQVLEVLIGKLHFR